VTQHAGYHPLEVNASDDRSAGTISTRVKHAIEASSGFGNNGRPTCVVLDEIDGATGGGDQVGAKGNKLTLELYPFVDQVDSGCACTQEE
jgi:DNA polymerase III delta prime subunit